MFKMHYVFENYFPFSLLKLFFFVNSKVYCDRRITTFLRLLPSFKLLIAVLVFVVGFSYYLEHFKFLTN